MNGTHPARACGVKTKMNCQELATKLAELQPEGSPTDIARLCLLVLNSTKDIDSLQDENRLREACRVASFRLEAAADQHSAMANELEGLCSDGPIRFSPDQIWTLLRAVKVQSQLLELYTETPAFV
jgi:hypothetical protein